MPLRRSSARYRVAFLSAALCARITHNPQQYGCLHARPSITADSRRACMRRKACVCLQVADRVVRGGGVSKSKAAEGAVAAVHEHFSHPNVLVAHLQEGIEVIHLYTGRSGHARPALLSSLYIFRSPSACRSVGRTSACVNSRSAGVRFAGRTICKLHLPSPGLHADVNGDGVLDHVQAYGETSARQGPQRPVFANHGSLRHLL